MKSSRVCSVPTEPVPVPLRSADDSIQQQRSTSGVEMAQTTNSKQQRECQQRNPGSASRSSPSARQASAPPFPGPNATVETLRPPTALVAMEVGCWRSPQP